MSPRASTMTPASTDAWPEFGIRFEKHGEPFPLPRLSRAAGDGGGPVHALKRRVDGAVEALNGLASVPFSGNLPLTQSQEWILNDVRRRVSSFGDSPQELDEDVAIRDLSTRGNLYSGEAAHLADYDISKIRVLRRRRPVLPAVDLLPEHAATYLRHFADLIEKSPSEMEATREDG